MQTFGEQLVAARAAAHMTQDELSKAINVSRSTISSWERNRTQPDMAMIRLLSQVLQYDFVGAPVETTAEDEAPQETPGKNDAPSDNVNPPQKVAQKHLGRWLAVSAAVVALCVAAILVPKLTRKPAPEGQGDVFSVEYYQQETPNEAGKAWLNIETRTWEETGDSESYQHYSFTMYETNGVGFNLERVDLQAESALSPTVRTATYGADIFRSNGQDPELPAYGSLVFDGGFPSGHFSRVGIAVYGNDANGAPLVFYSYIEF